MRSTAAKTENVKWIINISAIKQHLTFHCVPCFITECFYIWMRSICWFSNKVFHFLIYLSFRRIIRICHVSKNYFKVIFFKLALSCPFVLCLPVYIKKSHSPSRFRSPCSPHLCVSSVCDCLPRPDCFHLCPLPCVYIVLVSPVLCQFVFSHDLTSQGTFKPDPRPLCCFKLLFIVISVFPV